jgi:signal transduction histidine kinase
VSKATDERRLRSLIEVGRSFVAQLDLDAVFNRVLEVARELTGARYAALSVLDRQGGAVEHLVTLGMDQETRARIGELPQGRGVLGVLIDDAHPLRVEDVGSHPRSHGFPPGHPPMNTFLGVPIKIRGEPCGNLYLTEKESGHFDEADEETAVILAEWAAVAIENARLYEDVEGRRKKLERAVETLEATTTIALTIGSETDLERVLELIVKRGSALVDARALVILLEQGGELVVTAAAGAVPADLCGARVPMEGSVGGEVLRTGRAERLADISGRLRFALGALGVEAQSGLFVPLVFRGRALGVLEAFDHVGESQEFGADDERLLLSFAASAATAVATATAVAKERLEESIESSERERRRWARELHDETLQGLGALRVLLASALSRGPGALEEPVRTAVSLIETEIESLRRLIAELRPAALDEIGLEAAIQGLVERTASTSGLEVAVDLALPGPSGANETPTDGEFENMVYRLVQEGLTNAAKHSRGEHVRLTVAERDDAIEIVIVDDGVGFDTDASHEGFGIGGMKERVSMSGGTLEVESSPGSGARLQAVIPLPPAVIPDESPIDRAAARSGPAPIES